MIPSADATLQTILDTFLSVGFPLRVTSTDRDRSRQAQLYHVGATNVPPGSSLHEQGRAADVVPKWSRWTQGQLRVIASWAVYLGAMDALPHGPNGRAPNHVHIEFHADALER